MKPSGRDDARRAPIILRRIQRERTQRGLALSVLCPNAHRILNLNRCRGCEHSCGLCFNNDDGEIFQRCRLDAKAPRSVGRWPDSDEPALRSLLDRDTPSLGEDAGVRTMLAHFAEHAVGAAPVVDRSGQPVGFVHKSEVIRAYHELDSLVLNDSIPTAPQVPCARDLMRRIVFTLHPDDTITAAAALMGYEEMDAVLVQSTDILAAVTSFEVLRWLARTRA